MANRNSRDCRRRRYRPSLWWRWHDSPASRFTRKTKAARIDRPLRKRQRLRPSTCIAKFQDSVGAWRKFLVDRSNVRTVDLGTIAPLTTQPNSNDLQSEAPNYFCGIAGLGLDGEVTRRANHLPRWLRAHGGYALSLPPALVHFAPFLMKVSVKNEDNNWSPKAEKPLLLAAFANAPVFGGGMKIAPRAQLDDGLLDICLVSAMNMLQVVLPFPDRIFRSPLETECSRILSRPLACDSRLSIPSISTPMVNSFAALPSRLASHPVLYR